MKIVILDGYTTNPGDLSWDFLNEFGTYTVYDRTPKEKIVERAAGCDIIITNKTPIDAETIAALPELKFITLLSTGFNVVDVDLRAKEVYRSLMCLATAPRRWLSSCSLSSSSTQTALLCTARRCTRANGAAARISASGNPRSRSFRARPWA